MPSYSKLPPPNKITDFVWIQTGFIGDIILTTGAMERARELFPDARQHLITTKTGQLILQNGFDLASIHVFDKKDGIRAIRRTALAVRSQLGTQAVTLQPHLSARSTFLATAIGRPVVTFHQASLSCLAARRVQRIAVFHESDRNAILLEAFGIARDQLIAARPHLHRREGAGVASLKALVDDPKTFWIGVAPGSIWGTKRWPIENYANLVKRLLEHSELRIALIGGKDEQELCQEIVTSVGANSSIVNLAGKTSLDDLRALFPALNLVISNDSSPIHYASAYNVPTIALFGPTIPAFGFGPLAEDSAILETTGLPCRPCGNHGPQQCPLGHFKCMRNITVESVYKTCINYIQKKIHERS